jgi:hypothetical protein
MGQNSIYKIIHLPANSTKITLKVFIGGRQSGVTTIALTGETPVQHTGDFTIEVNDSSSLDGKSYNFSVVCADVNPSHNKLLVTVELDGINNNSPWTMNRTVSAGETYAFLGTIEFYK